MQMKFNNRVMTPSEKTAIQTLIDTFSKLEKEAFGISRAIDELQSHLLVMVDQAIVVQDSDDERFDEES